MAIDLSNIDRFTSTIDRHPSQISPLALNWTDEFLRDRKHRLDRPLKILEFGSGISTIWFGLNFSEDEIVSMEGDVGWYELVKNWMRDKNITNIRYLYQPQTNLYTTVDEVNPLYFEEAVQTAPFDLILNDGGMREEIGQRVMADIDNLLTVGGVYLRHDYEKLLRGDWVGFYRGEKHPHEYDKFCGEHDGYELITVSGNGKWGYRCELGGIWRKE